MRRCCIGPRVLGHLRRTGGLAGVEEALASFAERQALVDYDAYQALERQYAEPPAPGQFKATGFRIGHMGDIRMTDVERTLAALGDVMASLA